MSLTQPKIKDKIIPLTDMAMTIYITLQGMEKGHADRD
jgi:hypothetical protein